MWVTVLGNAAPLPIDAIIPAPGTRGAFYDPCSGSVESAPTQPEAAAVRAAPNDDARLLVDPDVTPPHGWRLSLYVAVLILGLHFVFGARGLDAIDPRAERCARQRTYRAQYLTYGVARGAVLLATFTYMIGVHALSLNAYRWPFDDSARSPGRSAPRAALAWMGLVAVGAWMCARSGWAAAGAIWAAWKELDPALDRLVRIRRFVRAVLAPASLSIGVLATLHFMAFVDGPKFRGGGRVLGVAYTLRALPLGSGASSSVVVVLIAGALSLWITDRMHRVRLSYLLSWCALSAPGARRAAPTPIADIVGDPDVKDLEARVQLAIDRSTSDAMSFGRSVLIAAVPLLALLIQRPTTIDGQGDGRVLVLLVTATMVLLAITLQHLTEFHLAFRRLLRRLRTWRLASTLDQAPGITGTTVLRLLTRSLDAVEPFAACVFVAGELKEGQIPSEQRAALEAALQSARTARIGILPTHLGLALVEAARHVARQLGPAPLPFPAATGAPGAASRSADDRAAQRRGGCVTAGLLELYARHVRYFVRGVSAPAVVLVLVLASYPFEPHRLFLAGAWILVLALAGISVWVYLGLERDVILSKISGTLPNTIPINRELIVTILTVVVLPLLTIFATQYPDVGRVLLRVFDPFSSVLK